MASDGRGDEVSVELGVMSVGERVPMACSKVCSGPAWVRANTFAERNNCLRQSGCGSKLARQKSWFEYPEELNTGSKADSHWEIRDHFAGGKTYQLDLVNLW